ncbi:MAG: BrnT family toxin [Gammaproteobacteria bacterium]|nr:MAG: BrnT family toxin [Gammaproteobacteria bacterium]
MEFAWDTRKAVANFKKHKVSFEEAATALKDTLSITGIDPDHSIGKFRWLTFGVSDQGRLLAVAHTEEGELIRIISARTATKVERVLYEEV